MTKTVLISGASVAGPALAFWLERSGFAPTVVERAPAPRPGGYAVDFRGASLTVLEQDDTGVEVVFERGGSRRFDLVVGADGLHSNTRALAFGPEIDFTHDLGYYASVFTVENHLGLDHSAQFLNAIDLPEYELTKSGDRQQLRAVRPS